MIGVTSIPFPRGPGMGSTMRSTSNASSETRNWPFRGVIANEVSPIRPATSSARRPAASTTWSASIVDPSSSRTVIPSAEISRLDYRSTQAQLAPPEIAASAYARVSQNGSMTPSPGSKARL